MPMKLELQFEGGRAPRVRKDGAPVRVVILGDFGGAASPTPGLSRLRLDLDGLDASMARLAPRLELGSDVFAPRALEDFHPDQLLVRLPTLAGLVDLRKRLLALETFTSAAEELRTLLGMPSETASPSRPIEAPRTGESLFATLIGGSQKHAVSEGVSRDPEDVVRGLIASIVAPDVTPAATRDQASLVRIADTLVGASLRAVLHDPRFQALESTWRALDFLVSRNPMEEDAEVYLVQARKSDITEGALTRAMGKDLDVSLVVCAYELDASEADVTTLAILAKELCAGGALLVAGASPTLATTSSEAWTALRGAELAPSIGLALPRFLLRTPYGKRSDPVAELAFEELGETFAHETLLWGNGAFIAAFAMLRARAEGASSATCEVDDLPSVVTKANGESQLTPCAEMRLDDATVSAMLDAGLMPLMSHASRNVVRFVRARSIANDASGFSL